VNSVISRAEIRDFIAQYRDVIVVVFTAAVSLLAIQYFVKAGGLSAAIRPFLPDGLISPELFALCGWSLGCVTFYLILPLIVCRLMRWSPTEFGFNIRGLREHGHIYALCFLPMAALILLVSTQPDFLAVYPFFVNPPNTRELLIWECCYAAQFIGLEFFFRGFLVHGLKTKLGSVAAVLVMLLPYLMIHFGKPLLESCGALLAGVALGFLSLRTGSISGGALLHIAVAWSMDTAALWREGWFARLIP
jgi:membrane protease YdiL (CAAX protease family)